MEKNTPTIYDIPLAPAAITRHIYLTEGFEEPSEYILTCQALLELEEYDRAEIHVNSGGGSVAVSNMLLNAMAKSKAQITTVLESNAHSAASCVFLSGDSFEVTPDATMILHVGFFGAYGEKASDTVDDAKFTESTHFAMIRRAYDGFLSEEEIERLLKGENFRLNADQITERLEKLVQYRAEKMQEMYEEMGVELEEVGESSNNFSLETPTSKGSDLCNYVIRTDEDNNPIELELLDADGEHEVTIELVETTMQWAYGIDFLTEVYTKYLGVEGISENGCISDIVDLCTSYVDEH